MSSLIDGSRNVLLELTQSKLLSGVIETGLWILIALILTLIVHLLLRFGLRKTGPWISHSCAPWGEWVVSILSQTRAWFIFAWIAVGIFQVALESERLTVFTRIPLVGVIVVQFMIWGFSGISLWKSSFLARKGQDDRSSVAAVSLIQLLLNAALVISLILLGLANLGVDIAALVAGLGVGGIAIALAAQNVLGDLLASLSIVLDKPFVVDDFIIVGSEMGTVESIGLKTTRVRSLGGEQLIFSNKDLLESRVRNMKRMKERRVAHRLGLVFSTPAEKLAAVPMWLREIVEERPELRFEHCFLLRFTDSALEFELVFWARTPEFQAFAQAQQAVLLRILQKFKQQGVEFAYPTQTVHSA